MLCRRRCHSWAAVTMNEGLQAGIAPCHMPCAPSWCAQDCLARLLAMSRDALHAGAPLALLPCPLHVQMDQMVKLLVTERPAKQQEM